MNSTTPTNSRQQDSAAPDARPGRTVGGNNYSGTHVQNDLRSARSRHSPNEQFAVSRQEFQFGDEDENDVLEPAPEIEHLLEAEADAADDEEDIVIDISDAEINRLLHTNEDEAADYYTLLGLSRNPPPTDVQVRAAYHRLSLAFHPDKHPHHLKDAAERHFTTLRRAYETLIEPRKRIIYDLEGEEGVQNEYRQGGAMGPGGETERQLSSVKVMNAKEFKKWFLGILYNRERRAIEALVDHESAFTVGLDATNNFVEQVRLVSDGGTDFTIPSQRLRLQEIGVQSSFTLPMPNLGRLFEARLSPTKQLSQSQIVPLDGEEVESDDSWINALGPAVPKLTITGSVSGKLDEAIALLPHKQQNDTPSMPYFDRFYSMTTQQVGIGARLSHTFPELLDTDANNSVASRLQGIDLEIETTILPHPAAMTLGLGKAVSFIADTRPFYMHIRSTVKDSPILRPPEVQVTITRAIGVRGNSQCYLAWQSGEGQWPSFIHQSLASIAPQNPAYVARWLSRGRATPVMKLGAIWSGKKGALSDDDEADYPPQMESINESASTSTNISLVAYAGSAHLSVGYGRDIFARYDEPPVRSRIMNSGEAMSQVSGLRIRKSRGVRLELEGNIGLPAVLDAAITGKRRIGTFTSVGLGVGVNQALGLYFMLSWNRLGQSISVPVALIPLEQTTTTAIMLAIGVPWVLYATVEFAILRPRMQRKRQRLIKAQRAKLRSNVAKRREEAQQAVSLMYPSVMYRQAQEEESSGLVILDALYGVRGKGPGGWKENEVADVTTALAALVDDGQLSLPRGLDKSQLIGFWDPAPLTKKLLAVRYMFGGKEHLVEVKGNQALIIPSRAHEFNQGQR